MEKILSILRIFLMYLGPVPDLKKKIMFFISKMEKFWILEMT